MSITSATPSFKEENQWCCTRMNFSKCSFTWTVENLIFNERKERLKSATFVVAGSNRSKWHLELRNSKEIESYSLFLYLDSCQSSEIEAKYDFSILKSEKDWKTFKEHDSYIFQPGSNRGFYNFISKADFVRGGKLSLLCEVHVANESVNSCAQSNVTVPNCQLSDDFETLFNNKNFSDVKLTAGGREYHVHKVILAARSKVFAGMFTHDMKENRSNQVNIPDIDGDVCKEMLHFIYTGKAPNLDKVAEGLLAAAEKYELNKLKAMCEEELTLRLNVGNAVNTMTLAELHSADQLKAQTLKFIKIHSFDVLQTESWRNIPTSHLHLFMETLLEESKPVAVEPTRRSKLRTFGWCCLGIYLLHIYSKSVRK